MKVYCVFQDLVLVTKEEEGEEEGCCDIVTRYWIFSQIILHNGIFFKSCVEVDWQKILICYPSENFLPRHYTNIPTYITMDRQNAIVVNSPAETNESCSSSSNSFEDINFDTGKLS